MPKVGFIEACTSFFGLRPDQSRMDFLKNEIKPLTDADRIEIAEGLVRNGIDVDMNNVVPKRTA